MKKNGLIVLLVLLVGVYWFFWKKDRFDQPIEVNGTAYELSKTVSRGAASNYFFTPSGQEFEAASEFIQVITFDSKIPENSRVSVFQKILSQYGLKQLNSAEDYHGTANSRGIDIVSTATRIVLDDGTAYAIYIHRKNDNYEEVSARSSALNHIEELRALESVFSD